MNEIKKKIALQKRGVIDTNPDEFMSKLHFRIKTSNTNQQTLYTSSAMLCIMLLLTITQFGAPDLEFDNYFVNSTENLIETDFWNINSDSVEYDQELINNMAYFLIDEGYIWETVELLDQFKLNGEESL